MKIGMDDLSRQFSEIESEALEAAERVFRSGRYILTQGEEVRHFERAYADYCETQFAIGTSSGTSALHIALIAAGVRPGDDVLVPAHTYIATAFAVSYTGAVPVLVDADPHLLHDRHRTSCRTNNAAHTRDHGRPPIRPPRRHGRRRCASARGQTNRR
jgi:dTDP-4-amino-4,6-dideoxygalactose transaminase